MSFAFCRIQVKRPRRFLNFLHTHVFNVPLPSLFRTGFFSRWNVGSQISKKANKYRRAVFQGIPENGVDIGLKEVRVTSR